MKRKAMSLLLLFAAIGIRAEEIAATRDATLAFSTNLAYLTLSAVSTNPRNALIILPAEAQIAITERLSLRPALTFVYSGNSETESPSALLLAECGISFAPWRTGLHGWHLGVSPGIGYAFDSRKVAAVASVEGGYQWRLRQGLFLGVAGGGKYVWQNGSLVMPDLKVRIGWAPR